MTIRRNWVVPNRIRSYICLIILLITRQFLFMKSLLISLLSLYTVCLFGQMKTAAVDSIVQAHILNRQFSGNILIADRGTITYQYSNGSQELGKPLAIGSDTHFGIASITKMFTAIAILQLVEEGKLDLEGNLAQYLPEYDFPKASKVTLHHLLLHISGLPNEKDVFYLSPRSASDMIQSSLAGKSGKLGSYRYNNLDYIVLGEIIEKVTNTAWDQWIQARILDPLQMTETGFLRKGAYPNNFAYSFRIQGEKNKPDPLFHIENFGAAGNMYSTTEDLLKLDQALYGDILLNEKSKELMYRSYPEYNYTGYSVWTYRYPFVNGQPRIMERRGGIQGMNVVTMRLLDTQQSIIILSNNDGFNPDSFGDPENLREALVRAICPE
jgi:CubicO group peptidase (beta-lactamase class C family)